MTNIDKSINNTEIIFNLAKETVTSQKQNLEALQNKAGVLIGFVGVAFGIMINAKTEILALPTFEKNLVFLSILLLAVSTIPAIAVIRLQKFKIPPNLHGLLKYINNNAEETMLQLISNWTKAWQVNNNMLVKVAGLLKTAIYFQTAAVLLIAASLFSILLSAIF